MYRTFLCVSLVSDPKTGTSDWESCQKLVSTVSTVEDFWALYHHIQPASELK